MAERRKFKDYVDPDGENVVLRWLNGLPKAAKVKINTRIEFLETVEQLEMPDARQLTGICDGLVELRVRSGNVQYRPLCYYGPERWAVTILAGAIEKGSKFEPSSACAIALKRKALMERKGWTGGHDFH
jgi:hypothetical protein